MRMNTTTLHRMLETPTQPPVSAAADETFLADAKATLVEYVRANGNDAGRALLAKHGAKKFSDLDDAGIKAILEELENAEG